MQSGPDAFDESRFVMTFFYRFGSHRNIKQFQISSRREAAKEILESSKLEFLEKFLANNFLLSEAENSTCRWLNRGGIAELPLLRTLFAIHQKFREPSFWEMMNSFVLVALNFLF